ncbi:unnamed protein product [Pseudo-nitzschia multistriata]|uniref:Mitochondrial import inner membrane translocase subunit TIM50 n=1 Tax=Pseudo-nitzschia multistriata TaxID=183589 RepID=A0A448YZ05_9STRA|nr:unnamed protein product [Pseudo-nitzschia multistriata]
MVQGNRKPEISDSEPSKRRSGKKARYSKNKKRELKEQSRLQEEEEAAARREQRRNKRKRKQIVKQKRPRQDYIDIILKCADQSLFTNSVVVDNRIETIERVGTGSSSSSSDETLLKAAIGESDECGTSELVVRIVSGCNLSNGTKESSSSPSSETGRPPKAPLSPHDGTAVPASIVARLETTVRVQPLLVLDLNGILCHRDRLRKRPQGLTGEALRPSVGSVAQTPVIPRSDLLPFLRFLDRNFCLAVWTSAKPKTAKLLLNALLSPPLLPGENSSSSNNNNNNGEDIRNKFLFVWSQNQCTAVRSASGEKRNDDLSNKAGNRNDDDARHDDSVVYEKHLPKIWKSFPLWSASNTLLMDDSPEKCPLAVSNAVHPPPLHGRKRGSASSLLSDEENAETQAEFFRKLVRFWNDQSHTSPPWTATADGTTKFAGDDGAMRNSSSYSCNEEYYRFLEKHAKGHMGWRPSTTNTGDA